MLVGLYLAVFHRKNCIAVSLEICDRDARMLRHVDDGRRDKNIIAKFSTQSIFGVEFRKCHLVLGEDCIGLGLRTIML